jgi:hypothetical protein
LKIYVNGILSSSVAFTNNLTDTSGGVTMGTTHSLTPSGYYYPGYLQDLRIYKGLAKYTQNFIPASTDPDILPDTPSGVSYTSNLTLVPSTDGAVVFDNNGDYLSLTSGSDFQFGSGNFTVECFVYPNSLSNYDPIIDNGSIAGNNQHDWRLYLGSVGEIWFDAKVGGTDATRNGASGGVSNGVVTGKWQHIAVVRTGNTILTFLDGVQVLSNSFSSTIDSNYTTAYIGYDVMVSGGNYYFDGFISNLHVVKGTALYTSNFTPPTGPISSVANTKLLCCKSNSSANAFDVSPGSITANGNAAATNFNPFTVNINTQRGKSSGWATWNPLDTAGSTLSNGNLNITTPSSGLGATRGTIGVSSGKWYYEHMIISGATAIGIMKLTDTLVSGSGIIGASAGGYSYYSEGVSAGYNKKINNGTQTDYGTNFDPGDTISIAFDLDAGTITFYKNGVSQGVAFSGLSGTFSAAISDGTNGGSIVGATNFGQKPFKFPPPAGFQPLALANTPRPTIVRPDQFVGVTTYTGNGTSQSLNFGFKPDFVWIKNRDSGSYGHRLVDSVRGASLYLMSHSTGSESTAADGITSFNSNGVSLGSNGDYNLNNNRHVAWAWKAGGNSNTFNINDVGYATASAAGLTAGSITPTGVSVNTKSGFSIITYTGTGSAATISHGIGKAPSFIIVKSRSISPSDWKVYHSSLGATQRLNLDTTDAAASNSTVWNDTAPTSSVFSVGTNSDVGQSSATYVAYLWAEIPGFSKFGSYVGNSSSDGPMVITGFKPRWIMIKSSTSAYGWYIYDTVRDTYNISGKELLANDASAEVSDSDIDILSNGFKLRRSSLAFNSSSNTFIYAAFAETPTQNLYGAQSNAR